MKIGFIGLGIMGRPMAKHLVNAGFDVMVTDLNQELVSELVGMGAGAGSYSEIGSQCDIVMMILPNADIVKSVILDEGGIASSMKKGSIIIDHSSVHLLNQTNATTSLRREASVSWTRQFLAESRGQ